MGNNCKRKDIQIFTLCFSKKDFQFLDDTVITPLQVGYNVTKNDVCELKDNTGENISDLNWFFAENTGTYWIWKNVNDCQYKGQMQYRRPLDGISENTDFSNIFSKYKVITCSPFHHPDHKKPTKEQPMYIYADTVEEGYKFSHSSFDINLIEMIVKSNYPEYAEDYDRYIKYGNDLYYSNGFIMKKDDYNRYCEFMFGCLNKYLDILHIKDKEDLTSHVVFGMYKGFYQRYSNYSIPKEVIDWQMLIGGFLSERLWTLWLLHNFKKEEIYEIPYNKMESNMFT